MLKKYLSLLIIAIFIILLFLNNTLIQKSIIEACTLFLTKLFPSLFPMMIICDLLIYFEMPELLCKLFGNIFSKVFHTSPYGAFSFFISIFSGTPTNAYLIKNLVDQTKITSNEAAYIFSFSFFPNPLFYYTMLQIIFPNNLTTIIKLFIAPYLTNLILGYLTRPPKNDTNILIQTSPKENFINYFIKSQQKAINTLLMILGTISIFLIINNLINPFQIPFISGLLELSQGLNTLSKSTLSLICKKFWTLAFISFGGLSIHLQIKSILIDSNISLKPFFKVRFWQILLSGLWIFW